MNRFTVVLLSIFAVLFFAMSAAPAALAQSQPFQASLTPEIAVHDRDVMIEGVSLNIWGENPQRGFSLGFVNGSTGDSYGFSWAFVMNYSDTYTGVHWALANYTKQDFSGWQHGFVNYTDRDFLGAQTGFMNYAGNLKGLQLGLLNYAETANQGVQVGLVNIIPENRWFKDLPDSFAPGMVFVNWRF